MPNVGSIPVLDVVVGLAFMYFVLSVVCSSISEGLSSILNLRAKNLETGLRSLLGSKQAADDFFEDWRIDALGKPKRSGGSRKPSYLPPRTVALVIFDTFMTAGEDGRSLAVNETAVSNAKLDQRAQAWLRHVADEADDVGEARRRLESSFNDVMDRAAGWYKRNVQVILLVLGLAVAGGLNADTINVADRLSRDSAIRAAVVAQAQKAVPPTDTTPTATAVEGQIRAARATALPLGWAPENVPDGKLGWILLQKVGGLLLTTFALMLGAPFWFDVLGKVARLRASGIHPEPPRDADSKPASSAPA
jgi:hypothetical protein